MWVYHVAETWVLILNTTLYSNSRGNEGEGKGGKGKEGKGEGNKKYLLRLGVRHGRE